MNYTESVIYWFSNQQLKMKKNNTVKATFLLILICKLLCGFDALAQQEEDAALVFVSTNIFVNQKKLVRENHFEIKINNRKGEKYTSVNIPFSNLSKIGKIEAFIKDADGIIIKKLKKSDIVTKSAIEKYSFYEDNFIQSFRLKHNVYPYTLVYSYQTIEKEFIHIASWIPLLDTDVPTKKALLKIVTPVDYQIRFMQTHLNEPLIETTADQITYQWEGNYDQQVKSQVFAPPVFDFLPQVNVVPLWFEFDKSGSLESWKSFGSWQNAIMNGLDIIPDSELLKIQDVLKEANSRSDTIKLLYHYLQDNTRYINISIETGGLKPYPASYVAHNKYGDCKALTNYFRAVLKSANIPSYYSKVYASNRIHDIDHNFPAQQFNHIILYLPGENESFWLDCTSDRAFDYLGTFTQNRDALIIDDTGSWFVRTPKLANNEVLESRTAEILTANLPATIKMEQSLRGYMYELVFDLDVNYTGSEKKRMLNKYLLPKGFEISDYEIHRTHRDAREIFFHYTASASELISQYGNDIIIQNVPFDLPKIETPAERTFPIQLDYPINKTDTLHYMLSDACQLKNPISFELNSIFGTYSYTLSMIDEHHLIVTKKILIHSNRYPLSDYEAFHSFYTAVVEQENKNIHLTKTN